MMKLSSPHQEHTVRDMIFSMSRTVPYTEYSSISDGLFGYVDTLCRNVGRLLFDDFLKVLKIKSINFKEYMDMLMLYTGKLCH